MTDLISMQSIFKERLLQIPDYQRGYAWEEEHRRDLLEDIEGMPDGKHHYTGTVVVHNTLETREIFGENYKVYNIVDGQQRITTLVILLNEIRKVYQKYGEQNSIAKKYAKNIADNYIFVESEIDSCIQKLTLHNDSNAFFVSVLSENGIIGDIDIASHKNLLDASREFQLFLQDKISKAENEEYFLEWIKRFLSKITSQMKFNFYEIEEEAEVGIIFEVMNDRGKSLSQLEKVKNYLIYMAYKSSNDDEAVRSLVTGINVTWKTIFQNLTSARKTNSSDEDQLLRFHWMTKYNHDTKRYDVHKAVKEIINNRRLENAVCFTQIKSYVDSLREFSYHYRDFNNSGAEHAFDYLESSNKKKMTEFVEQIGRLGLQATVMPLMISAACKWVSEPDMFLELIRLAEVYIFRVYATGERRSDAGVSKLTKLAYEIYHGERPFNALKSLRGIISEYTSDGLFRHYLENSAYNQYDWKGLKYFLYELERFEVNKMGGLFILDWETLRKRERHETIEHVLPQTMNNEWKSNFSDELHANNINRLGNLTLTRWNSSLSNRSFDEKKGDPNDLNSKTYRNSTIQIEKQLAKYQQWTEKEITERTKYMVDFAMNRWSLE